MGALNRTQKMILIVLAILDVAVIGGMAGVVVTTMVRRPALPAPTATATLVARQELPTWTPTVTFTPRPTLLPQLTNTPRPTATLPPTNTPVPPTPTSTPLPPGPYPIQGGDFDFILPNRIAGWTWDAYINWRPGDENYSPENSYAEPMFTAADDPARRINGNTLKIETVRWLKFRTWVHQTVTLTAGSRVYFEIKASAFSSLDRLIVKAGIDPTGSGNCANAIWGNELRINQDDGVVTLRSTTIVVPALPAEELATPQTPATPGDGREDRDVTPTPSPPQDPLGRVTMCFFAEPTYADVNNAAFFDQAQLIVTSPR